MQWKKRLKRRKHITKFLGLIPRPYQCDEKA
jgi:hypothetical protein